MKLNHAIHAIDAANRISKKKKSEAKTVSNYVKVAKSSLKLSIMNFKAQLALLDELATMSDEEKLEITFALLDTDQTGAIDASELTNFIRKMNAGMKYSDTINWAIEYVAANDDDLSGDLSQDEFKRYLDLVCKEVGSSYHEMNELILMNIFYSKNGNTAEEEELGKILSKQIKAKVIEKAGFYVAYKDKRMASLFARFDTNKSGYVSYQEAAIGLYKLIGDMKESALDAFDMLLMYDANEDRLMNYEEFTRVILHVCALKNKKWLKIADALVYAIITNPDPTDDQLAKLAVAEEYYHKAAEIQEKYKKDAAVLNALNYQKLQKLYDILDKNDDGMLSFAELAVGLRKYQRAVSTDTFLESIQEAKFMLIEFDTDENQKLDRKEFALVLVEYAADAKLDLHKLIDFLAVLALSDGDFLEEAYIQAISKKATSDVAKFQSKYGSSSSPDSSENSVVETGVVDDMLVDNTPVYGKNVGTKETAILWS
mmetsp:Transcript_1290/g.1664  ORF Transcript_1290/g.1664 Transcript_1290/m.1664 type:complete len:485 (+) Transcript_1290:108-1562(+)